MDNQDGFGHSLEKRLVNEFFDKLSSPWCKAFPKTPGCPKPEEPVEEAPPATTPTPTPAPAPVATQPPAVVAPPPVETKTQPASPPVTTQPPIVVAPPATTAPAVAKPSTTSITPQPPKEPEQAPVSNPGSGSSGESGQGNGSGNGSGSNGADKGNVGNAGSVGSGSGKETTVPVGSDNGNNAAVPPPNVTTEKAEVQPTATSGSHAVNGVLPGKILLAAPTPVASHKPSESGGNTAGDDSGDAQDGDNLVQVSQPSATSHHSAIQHNDQSIPTTLSTAWIAAGTPTSIPSGPSGESAVPGQVAGSDDSSWNPELNQLPTPGSTPTKTGGGATASETPAVEAPKTSNTGLVSGVAGGVVTIVILFLILFALLFKYRRTTCVQNFLIKYTPFRVAAYSKRDKKRSSMGKGLLYEDEPSSPTSPTMQEKGKAIDYGTMLPAPVSQPSPTAQRSPTKATHAPPAIDTTPSAGVSGAIVKSPRSPRSPTPNGCRDSMFERSPTGMSDYFPQPPSPTHSNHSHRDARNSVNSLGGVSIASSGIFSASMMSWPVAPPSTADSATMSSRASPPSTSYSKATIPFQPLQPMPPMPVPGGSQRQSVLGLTRQPSPKEGEAGPSNWRDSRPDSWGL